MRKNKLLFTTVILSSMLLSSCSFVDIFKDSYSSLIVNDARAAYVAGEIYTECNELTVIGKTRSGKEDTLSSKDYKIVISYKLNNEDKTFDGTTAFVKGGSGYQLTVSVGKLSSSLTLTVYDEMVYANSISLTGKNEIDCWESTDLSCVVSPSNCTVPVSYTLSDPTLATYRKTKNGITITGKKGGNLVVTAQVEQSQGVYISSSHTVHITETIASINMDQTYKTYWSHRGSQSSSAPLTGNTKVLVIPVWFTDSSTFISETGKNNIREDIQKAFFGSESDTGWQSVKTYYKYESDNRMNLEGTVSDWYPASINTLKAGTLSSSESQSFASTVSDWFFTTTGESRKDYDSDGDGFIDATVLIYAAPDCGEKNKDYVAYENLWAYCFWTNQKSNVENPKTNVFLWASYDFMYSKDKASSRSGKTSYSNGDTSHCNIDTHTYIHEFGHVLGLEDYYDYSGQFKPAGGFSMQDYNVGGHDPYSLLALGWASAYIPESSCTIVLDEFQSGHKVILLTPNFNEYRSPFDEYLLLELYTPNGLNAFDAANPYQGESKAQGPNAIGIRLWHIDGRLTRVYSNPISEWGEGIYIDATTANNMGHAMSNTYYLSDDEKSNQYVSLLGSNYYNYNILQLIRHTDINSKNYHLNSELNAFDLFYKGQSFKINDYTGQFVNGVRLNNGSSLGWSFEVAAINTKDGISTATINLTKN